MILFGDEVGMYLCNAISCMYFSILMFGIRISKTATSFSGELLASMNM